MILTVRITRTREVEVEVDSYDEAIQSVKDMYEGGDSCAELLDATYCFVNLAEGEDDV